MTSFSSPTFTSPSSTTRTYNKVVSNFTSPKLKRSFNYTPLSRVSDSSSSSTLCRCKASSSNGNGDSSSSSEWRWDSVILEAVKSAIKRFDDFVNAKSIDVADKGTESSRNDEEEWDWERWNQHFKEIDEQEGLVSILKLQLAQAVNMENYEDAARLKVAIAAAAANDTVGRVMSHLDKAIEGERYREAARIRDDACAGLVGWWAGLSENTGEPYGCIVQIRAEHGRYVARSYSPRQLATAAEGAPLFEVFLKVNKEGEYKQQAVYLKRSRVPVDFPLTSQKSSSIAMTNFDPLGPTDNKSDLLENGSKDAEDTEEDTEDSDANSGFKNVLRDMIPGVEVKVLKLTTPGKVDRDFISKVVEQIIEEENEEKDFELESVDDENESNDESDEEKNETELDAISETSGAEEQNEIAVKVVVGGLIPKISIGKHHRELFRVPATLKKKDRLAFTFTVEEEDSKDNSDNIGDSLPNKKAKLQNPRSMDHLILDLAKSIGKGKIPTKVLKDVGNMINLSLSQARNRQPLSGSTTFNRIENPASRDPLNGLYIGAHGLYTSEVIQLRRRYGQWKGDSNSKEDPANIEFYEYVEALKLTGDPYVPAGQIAFRAKIGKRYQLPHKGIIPEEFGVIARYRGQGRLAEPGFQNPRWVDGELVILEGKFIRGPVVGFVYWAPEYQFLVFFNRLRLQ